MVLSQAQIARAFGRRLTKEMLDQGYRAPRARIKADAVILQKKAGVRSLEMARRYIKGDSVPKNPKIIRRICDWLNVTEAYLLRGELPKRPDEMLASVVVDSTLLADCLKTTFDVAEHHRFEISQNVIAKISAYLYLGYVNGDPPASEAQIYEMMKVFSTPDKE